jgi:hypothetical protein
MPPWGGVKGFGEFRNDQALTAEQLEMITSWVEGGVPEGDVRDLRPAQAITADPWVSFTTAKDPIVATKDYRLTRRFRLDGLVPQNIPEDESVQIVAEFPDGSVEPLVWLYRYKPAFQHAFLLQKPLDLPAGSFIRGIPTGSSVLFLPVPAKSR